MAAEKTQLIAHEGLRPRGSNSLAKMKGRGGVAAAGALADYKVNKQPEHLDGNDEQVRT